MEIGKELTQKETIDGSIIAKVLSNLWRKYRVYLYTILYYLILNNIIIEEYYFKEPYKLEKWNIFPCVQHRRLALPYPNSLIVSGDCGVERRVAQRLMKIA